MCFTVWFRNNLKWKEHIEQITRKANKDNIETM